MGKQRQFTCNVLQEPGRGRSSLSCLGSLFCFISLWKVGEEAGKLGVSDTISRKEGNNEISLTSKDSMEESIRMPFSNLTTWMTIQHHWPEAEAIFLKSSEMWHMEWECLHLRGLKSMLNVIRDRRYIGGAREDQRWEKSLCSITLRQVGQQGAEARGDTADSRTGQMRRPPVKSLVIHGQNRLYNRDVLQWRSATARGGYENPKIVKGGEKHKLIIRKVSEEWNGQTILFKSKKIETRPSIGKSVLSAKQYCFCTMWSHLLFFLSHWYFKSLVSIALKSGPHITDHLFPLADQIRQTQHNHQQVTAVLSGHTMIFSPWSHSSSPKPRLPSFCTELRHRKHPWGPAMQRPWPSTWRRRSPGQGLTLP